MRYTRMRDFLSRRSRDRRGRDRNYDYNAGYDMAGSHQYDRMEGDYGYSNSYGSRGGDYYQSDRQYDRYNGSYGGMNYYPVRRSGYFNYNTYGGDRDYAEGGDFKLSPTEIRQWEKQLKQSGGGTSYTVDQIRQVAQQHGIRFDEFSPELLTVVANMMHSDYKNTVNGDVGMFVKLAKDFLCDEDFDGTPEEKAYLYYTAIVNKEDD